MAQLTMRGLDRWLAIAHKLLVGIGCALIVSLMVCVNTDLFMRSVFRHPIEGMSEMTEIFLLYITFLGTGWVYREDGHVVVDLLVYQVYAKAEKTLLVINNAIVGLVSLVLVYYGSVATLDHFMRGVRNVSVLETPMALIIVVIPIGSLVLFLEVLVKVGKILKNA
jgi:TRAP-type C4-dicarboxylate transport system permease small subunit